MRLLALLVLIGPWVVGCDTPSTNVIFENHYPPSPTLPLVVYRAFWQAVSISDPIAPGAASDPLVTFSASPNPAWVVLAPGWDPKSATAPTTFVVLQSARGLALRFNDTLRIAIDDTTFVGNCAAGSVLAQEQADFITQRVFAADFSGLVYDAATCTTASAP